jgi:hypothetical protein
MVATSAMAGALSLSGNMNITHVSYDGTADAKDVSNPIGVEQTMWASGSVELDNGMTVSLTGAATPSVSSSTYLTLDMGDAGSLMYIQADANSQGGLGKMDDMTPSAYEEVNDGMATHTQAEMSIGGTGFAYNTSVGGATVTAQYGMGSGDAATGDGAAATAAGGTHSSHSFGVIFPVGDTGLTIYGGVGEEGQLDENELDHDTIGVKYAMGAFTVGYQINNEDDSASSSAVDLETTMASVAFQVNENLAISYGMNDTVKTGDTDDQEIDGFSISYTQGAMSVKAYNHQADNLAHAAGSTSEKTEISIAFAF